MADGQLVDKNILKTLVPPNALNAENFQELSGKAFVEEVAPGKVIFKSGDVDRKTTYLLEGEITLADEAGTSRPSVAALMPPSIRSPTRNRASRRREPRPPARSPASIATCLISC